MLNRSQNAVYGYSIRSPRVTLTGIGLFLGYLALPSLMLLFAFDVFVWAVVRMTTGGCFALWCWL